MKRNAENATGESPAALRAKLIQDIRQMSIPNEMASDSSIPDYAKKIIANMEGLLKTAMALLASGPTPEEHSDEMRRQHSLVIANLPESAEGKSIDRAMADRNQVIDILNCVEVEQLPIATYRMGRKIEGKARLVKVEMPTRQAVRTVLRSKARWSPAFPGISIRESLSLAERQQNKALIEECKKEREKTGLDMVIYAGQIMERNKISEWRTKK